MSFKTIALTLAISGGLPIAAEAASITGKGIDAALQSLSMSNQILYRFAGREYCFYEDGWHGPGWYWCGYRLREGFGWGGPLGWRGWRTEGAIRERGRIGVERRGSVEERGRVGVEGRGRVGIEEGGGIRRGIQGSISPRGGGEAGAGVRSGAAAPSPRGGAETTGSGRAGGGRGER
jgi:hypothetical protein